MASEKPGEVERKVYFYRADLGQDEAGEPVAFKPVQVLKHIDKLSFDTGARYVEMSDGNAVCCWIDGPRRLRIAHVRRSGLPRVERRGKLKPLAISATSGLVEETQVLFFPKNIVGVAFNFYGPRLSRLAHYFAYKADGICPPVSFDPLLRTDVLDQLTRFEDVRLFQLKIRVSWAATLAAADQDLSSTFRTAAKAGGADEVEVILRPKKYSRLPLKDGLLSIVRRIAGLPHLHEEASKFAIRGLNEDTHRVEALDLLSDQLVSARTMILTGKRSRAVQSESAYSAIEAAHAELKDQLHKAAAVK